MGTPGNREKIKGHTKCHRNVCKFAAAGGIVYLTVNQGVFRSSSQDGAKSLHKLKPMAFDTIQKIPIPTLSQIGYKIASTWNSGVKKTCLVLSELPESAKTIPDQLTTQQKKNTKIIIRQIMVTRQKNNGNLE